MTKATADDVPIKPGDIILDVGSPDAWEKGVRDKRWPEATKFKAEIQLLSFGEGTSVRVVSSTGKAESSRK
ncbi:MAG TPA: hypothetical protein VFM05_02465 [Candidatus Saccharimonadales bacterium]|nr:hypothetical protein [Candidatus Saccharimonadales bacterium]